MRSPNLRALRCAAWTLAAAALAASALAAPKNAPKAPKPRPFDTQGVAALLQSGDPGKLSVGLQQARAGGKDAAPVAPLVERLLSRGLPRELAKAALEAAGDLGQASSSPIIRAYTRDRDVELRRAAVAALLKTKGPDAIAGLRQALSDADGRVRGIAASGLGALGAHDAMPDLLLALDHKVPEAAAAIGQLCKTSECDLFTATMGKIPFDIMTSGFDQILFRPDVNDDQKIRLVGRIREVGTGEAHRFLKDVLSRWSGSGQVKAALDQAVQATQGSPGAAEPAGAP